MEAILEPYENIILDKDCISSETEFGMLFL